jgi:diadenylate cyclase
VPNARLDAEQRRLLLNPLGFGPLDVIDILILAVLMYQTYTLLIHSRAWNVLRGVAVLAALWFVANQFGLSATSAVFNNLAPVAFIGVMVVFQPELRAALERFGRGRRRGASGGDPVKELMAAIRELAQQRTGALIAVEQSTPLREYGRAGTELATAVSAPLLQTLFASQGPLHDGAVIIKDDLITHAGAIFPLSERDRDDGFSVKLGTRHRAALGLSEVSDALVLVVSEERGTVSVARDGVLRVDIAPAAVLTALREVYQA